MIWFVVFKRIKAEQLQTEPNSGLPHRFNYVRTKAAGLIHTAPHYNSISKALEDPNSTKTLKELIIRSSLPLRVIELAPAGHRIQVRRRLHRIRDALSKTELIA